MLAIIVALCAAALPAHAAPWAGNRTAFASPRFEQVWRNADRAVQQGQTNRSWTWGPQPWFDYKEVYRQSPNGLRLVQYFDKARMEINDPGNIAGPLGGVTNGLLTVELVSGRIKLGDGIGPDQNQQAAPAEIPVAGEATPASNPGPTYASFRSIATIDNGYRDPNRVGQRVGTTFQRDGRIGFRQDLAHQPGTEIVAYEPVTGHNIPKVFDDFRSAGPVPAIAAFGYPITDAYWTTVQLGPTQTDVLVQLFERRTLTYTPSNPAAFRVEMGNVGQHYFQWRYQGMGYPWAAPDPQWSIVFASKTNGQSFDMYLMEAPGSTPQRIMTPQVVPSSMARSWLPHAPTQPLIFGEATIASGNRQIITLVPGAKQPQRFSNNTANEYDAAVSPDGKQVAFISDRDGNPDLYLALDANTVANPIRLTESTACSIGRPSWLPDGSGLIYESNCLDNNWEIYRANLSYTVVGDAQIRVSMLVSPVTGLAERLTTTRADERWPRVSPDGSQIALFSNRDGNTEIYSMSISGGQQTRLTNNASRDEAPVWSPDGSLILFNSDRDGDHELYATNLSGSTLVQVTHNSVDDGYAVWGP
ncbi:MAG TPA: hypothetical protein VFZ66_22375 [Herpetosiphonaceae bacterium]